MTSERDRKNVTQNATKQEIAAALKLVGLLYSQGEIPAHVYRNICNEYYGKGLDIGADARYTPSLPLKQPEIAKLEQKNRL